MATLVYHVTRGDFVFIFVCFFSAGLFRLALPAYGFVSTKQLEEIRLPAKRCLKCLKLASTVSSMRNIYKFHEVFTPSTCRRLRQCLFFWWGKTCKKRGCWVCKHRRESKVHFELGRCQKSVKLLVELEQQHRGKQFWPWLLMGRVLLMFSPGLGNDRMDLYINLF